MPLGLALLLQTWLQNVQQSAVGFHFEVIA